MKNWYHFQLLYPLLHVIYKFIDFSVRIDIFKLHNFKVESNVSNVSSKHV